jgi:hypothetical protein
VAPARWIITLVLGVVLVAIGVYIAARPLWTHNATLMGARWLDMAVAAVSMLRGAVNIRVALRKIRVARG